MLKSQVRIGGVYRAKVGNRITDVKILEHSFPRGWRALNVSTGREVRIKSAAKLRIEIPQAEPALPVDYKSRAAGERDE